MAREYGFPSWPKLKVHVESVRAEVASMPPVSPFAGRWIADISRSTRHPANQFQRAVIDFAINGNTVLVKHGFIDGAGLRQHGENTILVDGASHVTENGYALTTTWRDARQFETVATKDGAEAGRGTYEVSADGLTLTIASPEQVIVLGRE